MRKRQFMTFTKGIFKVVMTHQEYECDNDKWEVIVKTPYRENVKVYRHYNEAFASYEAECNKIKGLYKGFLL